MLWYSPLLLEELYRGDKASELRGRFLLALELLSALNSC